MEVSEKIPSPTGLMSIVVRCCSLSGLIPNTSFTYFSSAW